MDKQLEPFILLKTFDDKIIGVKNIRYKIENNINVAYADVTGDEKSTDKFVREVTELLKRYCEDNYKEYGVVNPNG